MNHYTIYGYHNLSQLKFVFPKVKPSEQNLPQHTLLQKTETLHFIKDQSILK